MRYKYKYCTTNHFLCKMFCIANVSGWGMQLKGYLYRVMNLAFK